MSDWWNKKQDDGQQKRLMWAVVISAVVLFGFDWVVAPALGLKSEAPVAGQGAVQEGNKEVGQGERGGLTEVLGGEPEAVALQGGVAAAQAVAQVPVQDVVLRNGLVEARVSSRGAALVGWTLLHLSEEAGNGGGYRVLKPEGDHARTLMPAWQQGSGLTAPEEDAVWEVSQSGGDTVTMVWRNATGQVFSRTYKLEAGTYAVVVTDSLYNTASLPVSFVPRTVLLQADAEYDGEHSSFVNYFGPMGVAGSGEDYRVVEHGYKSLRKGKGLDRVAATGGWWGMTSQYFMAAIVPGDTPTERWFGFENRDGREWYRAVVQGAPVVAPPGEARSVATMVYLGPKQDALLQTLGHNLARAVDWGWFKVIAKPLHGMLVWFYGWLGNWGLAIVALTLVLKLVTYPLSSKSYRAMAKMKNLQPEVEQLKKDTGGNQQEMATRLMALYAREKVNPLSGCWPMLVQIPIFFAMYKMVLVSFEFRHAPLGLWISDLSVADPYFVLPVLMGASMWLQMRMQPPVQDPVQAAVFKWMPVIFTVMFLWFPAALVLYWLANNVLSIAQQWLITRAINR